MCGKDNKIKITPEKVWEGVAYVCLALTIAGQVFTTMNVLIAQAVWLISNVLFVARDFALKRPVSDKVKDVAMCGSCEGTCIFSTFWYIYKCEVDMQIARTTTHCKIAKCALKKLPTVNLLLLNKPRLTF